MNSEKFYIDIHFTGKGFSPLKLQKLTNLPLEIRAETGQLATHGRYKGQPLPYGIATLSINTPDSIEEYVDKLVSFKNELEASKVSKIVVDIESNLEYLHHFSVSSELAEKISDLKAEIKFNVLKQDTFEELVNKVIVHLTSSLAPSFKNKLIDDLHRISHFYPEKYLSSDLVYALIIHTINANISDTKTEKKDFENLIKEYNS